jgi:transcriptional regulator with XRE-family HTH domain
MTLGQVIRDARIAAHLSIEQLSDMTSVRIGLLTEMEENNFSHCGGDTYARGHLRNIANKVGVDPNVFIKLYNEEHSLENRAIGDLLVENNVMSVPVEKKSISWKVPAAISLSVLFLFGVVQIVMSNQSSDSQPVAAASATPTAEAPVAPTPTEPATPAPTVAASDGKVTLKLSAVRGNSYIDVIVDGTRVIKGSLFQGDTKNFEGSRAISVYLSNPAGLDVTHDGELLPPLGGQNEEVRRTFR